MNLQNVAERFDDAIARIEKMTLLASACDYTSPSEILVEFIENEDWEILTECFGDIPEAIKEDWESAYNESLFEWLFENHKLGFLLQFATPSMSNVTKRGEHYCGSYSWGHYLTKWLYADSLEDVMEKGFSWVESVRERELEKGDGR